MAPLWVERPHSTFDDPIAAEVRKAGAGILREANYDIHAICERLREAERQHPERLVKKAPVVSK